MVLDHTRVSSIECTVCAYPVRALVDDKRERAMSSLVATRGPPISEGRKGRTPHDEYSCVGAVTHLCVGAQHPPSVFSTSDSPGWHVGGLGRTQRMRAQSRAESFCGSMCCVMGT